MLAAGSDGTLSASRLTVHPAGVPPAMFVAGAILVLFAGFLWSLQGVTIRWIETASPAQIVFWRNLGQFATFTLILGLRHRGRLPGAFRRAGRPAFLGGLCQFLSTVTIVYAFTRTTVADVVFILSFAPFLAAVLAWLFLGERLSRRTWAAMIVGTLGVGVMVAEGLAGGRLLGDLLAVAATLGFAGLTVIVRWRRRVDMMPTVCWGSGLAMAFGLLLTGGDLWIPARDLYLSLFMGSVQIALGQFLYIRSSRYVPAGLLAFLSLSEIVLSPIWAWLGAGEVPSAFTVVGGAIVLGAVLSQPLAALGRRRAR